MITILLFCPQYVYYRDTIKSGRNQIHNINYFNQLEIVYSFCPFRPQYKMLQSIFFVYFVHGRYLFVQLMEWTKRIHITHVISIGWSLCFHFVHYILVLMGGIEDDRFQQAIQKFSFVKKMQGQYQTGV